MQYLVRAFPLIRHVDELSHFVESLKVVRREDTAKFYRRLGVVYESMHLQSTAMGQQVIVLTVIDDLDAAAQLYRESWDEFNEWFKKKVLFLSGIDPTTEPLGPPTEEVFSWEAEESLTISSDETKPCPVCGTHSLDGPHDLDGSVNHMIDHGWRLLRFGCQDVPGVGPCRTAVMDWRIIGNG